MSTLGSKHIEENNILCINNNQCVMLVVNICLWLLCNKVSFKNPGAFDGFFKNFIHLLDAHKTEHIKDIILLSHESTFGIKSNVTSGDG